MWYRIAFLGGYEDRITVLRNAVYDGRLNYMSLKMNENNQGGVALDVKRKDPCLADGCLTTVKTILMDDLLEVNELKIYFIESF